MSEKRERSYSIKSSDTEKTVEKKSSRRAEDDYSYDDSHDSQTKIKTKKTITVIVSILLIASILVVGFVVLKANSYLNLLNYDTKRQSSPQNMQVETFSDDKSKEVLEYEEYLKKHNETVKELPSDENVTNILLIGTDNRSEDEAGRSDSIIVVSINSKTKKLVITSIMRDLYVEIPGYGNNRINAAFAFGGPKLLIETIEKNLNIPIDRYIQVDFFSFMKVIDVVGGVDINVYAGEIEVMQKYIKQLNGLIGRDENTDMLEASDAGMLHLNGIQALAYSRNRYSGNADFERTNRQRKIIDQVLEKAKDMTLFQIDELAQSLLPNITTDMSRAEVLSLVIHSKEYLYYRRISLRIPMDKTWHSMTIDGMDVIGMDIDKNYEKWYKVVYG